MERSNFLNEKAMLQTALYADAPLCAGTHQLRADFLLFPRAHGITSPWLEPQTACVWITGPVNLVVYRREYGKDI